MFFMQLSVLSGILSGNRQTVGKCLSLENCWLKLFKTLPPGRVFHVSGKSHSHVRS